MRLTRQGDYAVRVMVDLAIHENDAPVPRARIQERQDVPPAYLAKIIQMLVRAGLDAVTLASLREFPWTILSRS